MCVLLHFSESIIKALSCPDSEKQNLAMQEADKFLQQYKDDGNSLETDDVLKTKSDRTVICKSINDGTEEPTVTKVGETFFTLNLRWLSTVFCV